MPRIKINEQQIDCRPGISVLQAALEAGFNVPHYCYHPGLSVVASCRLCLMQMKMPNPRTGEPGWSPKLMPSCQTKVRGGMEVRFDSPEVTAARTRTMEFYLLNHPLDCPVCDKAGECHLQDYSRTFGRSTSRMVEQKHVTPKKDIGEHTLLYTDRCVFCKRCIRFTDEVSGTFELCAVNRGSHSEIDIFPGMPLDNAIQGNVVDLCPVGSLLNKDFLFQQRVWFLTTTPSICSGCATGCAIHVDHNDGRVHRLRPRFNPGVNDWWMCDEGRFGQGHVHHEERIVQPTLRRGGDTQHPLWEQIPEIVRVRLEKIARRDGADKVAVMLSPFMSCEEAWMLTEFVREIAPAAALVAGPIPHTSDDQTFPVGAEGDAVRFTISNEKCPNRRGVELVIEGARGTSLTLDEYIAKAKAGGFAAAWIVGGYPSPWVTKELGATAAQIPFIIVQDMFSSAFTEAATLILPACASVEREGSFVNQAGKLQPFARAIAPPEGVRPDNRYLYEIAARGGLYRAEQVRGLMAEKMEAFGKVHEPPPAPRHLH